MAENRPLTQFLSMPTLLALVALLGLIGVREPLRTLRPPASPLPETPALAKQDVMARLWQDPFEAVRAHIFASNTVTNNPAHAASDIRTDIATSVAKHRSVLILTVMETGRPYADDHESRIKSRYAVVSALGVAGCEPADSEHVGFVVVDNATNSMLLPLEWYRCRPANGNGRDPLSATKYQAVLVLWLAEEEVKQQPLEGIRALVEALHGTNTWSTNVSVKVIGPRGSTALRRMLRDTNTTLWVADGPTSNRVEVYSSWATAADRVLTNRHAKASLADSAEGSRRSKIADRLRPRGVEFHNVVCTDDELLGEVIRELSRRGVDLLEPEGTDRVVLLAEWDTFYGRVMPQTFEDQLKQQMGGSGPAGSDRIQSFTYLKGLDGLLPADRRDGANKASDGGRDKGKAIDVSELERPEGQSQLDYMPRLAAQLRQADRGAGHEVKAVGILGSDVYDKLLLLQSLREQFPDRLFFTTDLDARLLHPSTWKWTHNLIVVSSFGLELSPELQQGIPPFRDSYQTGQFLACLMAVGYTNTTLCADVKPQVYEVGRYNACLLSTNQPSTALYRQPHRPSLVRNLLAVVALLLLLTMVLQYIPALWRALVDRRHVKLLVTLGVTALVMGVLIWADQTRDGGEPFSLREGISIWPTEILRLVSFFLCWFFLIKARHDLRTNDGLLGGEFQLVERVGRHRQSPTGDALGESLHAAWWRRMRGSILRRSDKRDSGRRSAVRCCLWMRRCWRYRRRIDIDGWKECTPRIPVARLWRQYQGLGDWGNRIWRVLLATATYIPFGVCLFLALERPAVPYRGAISLVADRVILFVGGLALVWLVFFVVDATRLCQRFVHNLQACPSQWPPALLTYWSGYRGGEPDDLADWLNIRMIARCTEVVGRLVYYPFIVILLMILARNPWFDDWRWPPSLVIIFGVNSAFALCCGLVLRHTAEKARRKAIDNLEARLLVVRRTDGDERRAKPIGQLVEEIKAMREGAFSPYTENPVLGAILIPLGGTGIVSLIQYLFGLG